MSQQINLSMFTNTYKLAVRDLMILSVNITDKHHTAYIYMVLFAGVAHCLGHCLCYSLYLRLQFGIIAFHRIVFYFSKTHTIDSFSLLALTVCKHTLITEAVHMSNICHMKSSSKDSENEKRQFSVSF